MILRLTSYGILAAVAAFFPSLALSQTVIHSQPVVTVPAGQFIQSASPLPGGATVVSRYVPADPQPVGSVVVAQSTAWPAAHTTFYHPAPTVVARAPTVTVGQPHVVHSVPAAQVPTLGITPTPVLASPIITTRQVPMTVTPVVPAPVVGAPVVSAPVVVASPVIAPAPMAVATVPVTPHVVMSPAVVPGVAVTQPAILQNVGPGAFTGRNILGQQRTYIDGQPVRNLLRFIR